MKELFAGIFSHFNATNDFKTAVGGRLYPDEAPQEPTFPYSVYSIVDWDSDFDFSDDHEEFIVQFSCYSEEYSSPSQILDLFSKFIARFDDAKITVSGWTVLKFQRKKPIVGKDHEMQTRHFHVDYDILLERRRA